MAGYDHDAGMSNNAVAAYCCGIKPISKITAQDLKDSGVQISKSFAVWLAKKNYWPASEWHHSGGTWYNKVNFYDPDFLANLINDGKIDIASLENEFKTIVKTEDQGQRVSGSYAIWGGSRKRPRKVGKQKFTGTKKGNWIFLDSGVKKKANGNYINWRYTE